MKASVDLTQAEFLQFTKEIQTTPTAQEEHNAFCYYQDHKTIQNRNSLVLKYQRLVYSQVQGYQLPPYLDKQDMIQEGMLGLLQAVEKFDPDYGTKFSTLSYFYIQKGCRHYLQKNHEAFHVPESLSRNAAKVERVQKEWKEHTTHSITVDELMKQTELSQQEVKDALQYLHNRTLSLDSSANTNNQDTTRTNSFNEWLPCEDNDAYQQALKNYIPQELQQSLHHILDAKTYQVLAYRLGFTEEGTLSRAEIAKRLHISPNQVTSLYNRAIYRIRNSHQNQEILELLSNN